MTLETGRKLSHYEIIEPIGKGGMGEVYRALDGKLGREVAIKVLPDEFARDAERVARFKREAKVLASLNHPNIAAIHGFEESDGTHFLVLELVPGETLAERIARGPIPIDEAIAIATKIAEGLEEAHEQGIVHRDLKPANIKLTPDDKIKILDFGLAKAFVDDAPVADDSMSPTITRDATRAGVILGTTAYMSPEQAKGKKVDRRADIFAFGSVLYEMLTGKKAFRGDGVSDVLAAVIKDEPNWDALPDGSLQRVVRRCLAKPVGRRFQHVGDVRIELEEPVVAAAPGKAHRWGSLWVAVALIATAVASWALFRAEAPERKLISRWRISLPSGTSLGGFTSGAPSLAIAPDGRHLAYVVQRDDHFSSDGAADTQLYSRAAEALDATRIDGAENAGTPFFSPDGEALGFESARGILMRVSVNGGAPVAISNGVVNVRGASWSLDGTITFGANLGSDLRRVPAAGGETEVLAQPDRQGGIKALRLPDVLPRGDVVLFTLVDLEVDTHDDAAIAALWPSTGEIRVLVQGGTSARYSPTGHIVYARGGALYAAAFDAENVQLVGDPVRVLEGVTTYPMNGPAEFDLSLDGSLLYAPGVPLGTSYRLVYVDRQGRATTLVDERRPYIEPRMSPDGRSLAVSTNDANTSVWRYDLAQGALTRIVSGGNNSTPAWTPDSASLAFTSDRNDAYNMFLMALDNTSAAQMLVVGGGMQLPLSWAPDGRTLLFRQSGDNRTGSDLWLFTVGGGAVPILETNADEAPAQIAPNGQWMAYQSDESGRPEVYVCEFPGAGARRRVSVDGGTDPRWNPNGRELFYRSDNKMMVVEVRLGDTLSLARPRLLFESDVYVTSSRMYDVSADGERFVMIDASESPKPPTELVLVQNWSEELKRLVPTND